MVELPKPPWYRRFGVVFVAASLVAAAVLVVVVLALWPRAAAQRPSVPATTAGVGPQARQLLPEGPEPATILPTSTTAHLERGVLWQRRGSADLFPESDAALRDRLDVLFRGATEQPRNTAG